MKNKLFTTVFCSIFIFCCACSEDDDTKQDDPNAVVQNEEKLEQIPSPEKGGKAEFDQSNFGEYIGMITGGNYVSDNDAVYPDHFGIAGRLDISLGGTTTAQLFVEEERETFTAEYEPVNEKAVSNLKFTGDKQSVFWFSVGANGKNPKIDSIKITAFGQNANAPQKWGNPLRATMLKNTSSQPVSVFSGEVILSLRPHLKVCAIKQVDKCIFDFGGTYRFYDFNDKCFETSISGNNITYNANGQSIQAKFCDDLAISGHFNSKQGSVEFNLINTSYFPEFKKILTDPANDNNGGSPGADIFAVNALNTKSYLGLQVQTKGEIKNFLSDHSNGKSPAFAFWISEKDDVFVFHDEAFLEDYTARKSFSGTNNYIIRLKKSFFVILNKNSCLDSENEIEFSLSSSYGYMKSYDDTDRVILKVG